MRAILLGMLFLMPLKLIANDSNLTAKQSQTETVEDLDSQIAKLKKLKEYYEVSIRRANRTAWRLEFKDPGYSRQLDQRVKQYKEQLDKVNKELDEKMAQKNKMKS